MKRTKLLQEPLMFPFEEAYEGWQKKKFKQEEAARLLGVSDRTCVWRIVKKQKNYNLFLSFAMSS